jgi:hypothetical protein
MKEEFLKTVDPEAIIPEDERLTLEWRHISYVEKVRESKKFFTRGKLITKRILTDVSGIAKPGNLVVRIRCLLILIFLHCLNETLFP